MNITGIIILILAAVFFFSIYAGSAPQVAPEQVAPENVEQPSPTQETPVVTQDRNVFTGTLESIHEGCYYDASCYAVVSGVQVTVLTGRRQEEVGSVVGVASFGDLKKYIGSQVEVYAKPTEKGYTLYGSKDYYLRLKFGT